MMEELLLEDARCGNEEESLSITGGNQQENLSGEAPTTLNTEMDDLKRSNLTLLRIAIETKTNPNFIYTFAFITLSVFVALLLYQASVNKTFILFVMLNPFGRYQTQFEVTTSAISLFAVFCDFKEIYHILRHNIPLRSHWRPLVTVDKSDEVQALFIGPHTVKLNDIFDSHFFSEKFIKAVAAGYLLAAMPLALV